MKRSLLTHSRAAPQHPPGDVLLQPEHPPAPLVVNTIARPTHSSLSSPAPVSWTVSVSVFLSASAVVMLKNVTLRLVLEARMVIIAALVRDYWHLAVLTWRMDLPFSCQSPSVKWRYEYGCWNAWNDLRVLEVLRRKFGLARIRLEVHIFVLSETMITSLASSLYFVLFNIDQSIWGRSDINST